MRSEHLSNVHPGWVVGGWLVSVAVGSGVFLAMAGLGLVMPRGPGAALTAGLCVAVGFFAGGLFIALRWMAAPILHGAALTLVSVLVWFLGNLLLPGPWEEPGRELDSPRVILGLILLQFVSSVSGGLLGRRGLLGGSGADRT